MRVGGAAWNVGVAALLAVLAGCRGPASGERSETAAEPLPAPALPSASAEPPPASPSAHAERSDAEAPVGDPHRGRELALSFECNRCHDGAGHPAMATEKHCFRCHEDIATGRFGMGSPKLGRWRATTAAYRHAPSLEAAGARFEPDWIRRFLLAPYDLRPHLTSTMPRLALTPRDAADLAAFLTRDAVKPSSEPPRGTPDLKRGRALLEAKGCGGCHEMTGVPALPSRPDPSQGDDRQKKGIQLAPDLRHTRDRFREVALVEWLVAPARVKRDTVMPSHGLTAPEASDIAA